MSGGRLNGYLRAEVADPLLRTAYSLMLNALLASALGLGLWLAAARLFDAGELGRDAALIAVMVEMSTICQLNGVNANTRFLPSLARHPARALLAVYGVSGALALLLATAFVLLAPAISHEFGFFADDLRMPVLFVLAQIGWGWFVIQDAALVAVRRAPWVLAENAAFGVLKLAALPLLLIIAAQQGVFLAWMLPALLLLVPVNVFLFRRAIPEHFRGPGQPRSFLRERGRARLVRLMAMDYGASVFRQGAATVRPATGSARPTRPPPGRRRCWSIGCASGTARLGPSARPCATAAFGSAPLPARPAMTLIPVLLYHSISDTAGLRGDRFTVSPAELVAHANALRASDRTPLSMTELAEALRGERPLPERPVAVTFDDGYADTYDAVATLLAHGIPSTVYATAAEVGTENRLSPAQLYELVHTPLVEIGAHAFSHRRLDELDDPAPFCEARTCKTQLEALTQVEIRSFAYPHGAYDGRARGAVIEAGYRSAAAVKNAVPHAHDDVYAIARWTVTAGTPASRIAQVLEGVGVPVAWAGERWRTRAYRVVRRARRRLGGRR